MVSTPWLPRLQGEPDTSWVDLTPEEAEKKYRSELEDKLSGLQRYQNKPIAWGKSLAGTQTYINTGSYPLNLGPQLTQKEELNSKKILLT